MPQGTKLAQEGTLGARLASRPTHHSPAFFPGAWPCGVVVGLLPAWPPQAPQSLSSQGLPG